jgi:hypothetical protein
MFENMQSVVYFLYYLILAAFAFFGVGPCIMSAISQFGVQKMFGEKMIEQGVIKAEDFYPLQKKKTIAGVVISVLLLGILVYTAIRLGVLGIMAAALPLAVGILKSLKVCQYNSLTVKRFRNSFQNYLNGEKYNKFVKENFNESIDNDNQKAAAQKKHRKR